MGIGSGFEDVTLVSHFSQFSIISSGIRENSFTLPVTRIRPKANAWAAMSKSLPPIGVPARSKATSAWHNAAQYFV